MTIFPFLHQSVGFPNLRLRQVSFGFSGISFSAVQTEPEICLREIQWNSMPFPVKVSQVISSLASATHVWNVLCRHSKPFGGKPIVLLYPFADLVFLPQNNLRIGVASFSSFPIPFQCQFTVYGSKPVVLVSEP